MLEMNPSICPLLPEGKGLAVALGNFDGVHLGHRALLKETVRQREKSGGELLAAVWSPKEHPQTLLGGEEIAFLTSEEEKIRRFRESGIDFFLTDPFASVRSLSPEAFVKEILVGRYRCRAAVCGYNFRFGKGGAGDAESLSRLMKENGGEGIVLPPVLFEGKAVSSSAIRVLIEKGEVERAEKLLGEPFSFAAEVVHGKALGQKLGFPTVNQFFPEHTVRPKNGVYLTCVETSEGQYPGVTNVGIRPTVEDGEKCNCETHLLGFSGDLYGKKLRVSFLKALREESKFETLSALRNAVLRDIDEAKTYFSLKRI